MPWLAESASVGWCVAVGAGAGVYVGYGVCVAGGVCVGVGADAAWAIPAPMPTTNRTNTAKATISRRGGYLIACPSSHSLSVPRSMPSLPC